MSALRRFQVALVLGALALAGCAHPTPYQAATNGQGYAEQALEQDRVRVSFAGNTLTPRETVENYLLYRAAELTQQRGYDHFIVAERSIERSTTYRSTLSGAGGSRFFGAFHHGFYPHGFYPRGFGGFSTVSTRPLNRYTGVADILMAEGEAPEDRADAYDASDVLKNLAPTISRRNTRS